jgi:ketosteroid isomerase-like protein
MRTDVPSQCVLKVLNAMWGDMRVLKLIVDKDLKVPLPRMALLWSEAVLFAGLKSLWCFDQRTPIHGGKMRRIFIAMALCSSMQLTAVAQDNSAVIARIHQFVDAFNHGDTKAMVAASADQVSIIDEFPPHSWSGAGAIAKWMSDYDADAKKNGITDGVVTIGSPRHIDVTADRAYVVVPSDYTYKQNGKVVKETGSIFTVVLQKSAAGWRIVAWSWANN